MKSPGNLFILGDSYSTFVGYIPKDHLCYYDPSSKTLPRIEFVEDTWWYSFTCKPGANLVLNSSWSGSTICHTGYDGADCCNTSFVGRMNKLIDNGFFESKSIDTFLIFGGTNDSWADSPIGKPIYSDWKKTDLYNVLPAFCYLLDRISTIIPKARVICLFNDGLKPEIINNFEQICKYYRVEYLNLKHIDKENGHPTVLGMSQIRNQLISIL